MADEPRTLAEQWRAFARAVVPRDASPTQRTEMRRAFYAGANATMGMVLSIDESISDDEGSDRMHAWCDELQKFAEAVRDGRA